MILNQHGIAGLYMSNGIVRLSEKKSFRVGGNIIDSSVNVDTGTNWSGDVTNGFTHSSGATDELVFEVSTVDDASYVIEADVTGTIESRLGITIGDNPYCDPYNGTSHIIVGVVSDGGYVKFKAIANNLSITLTNIKCRKISTDGTGDIFELTLNNIDNGQAQTNISGFWNVAIGPMNVQNSNENGTRNIAIGNSAQGKLKTGSRNIAVGTFAMPFVEQGDNNIAIGADTIYSTQTHSQNVANNNIAIGKATMHDGTNIDSNIAIGNSSMAYCDLEANKNVCVGPYSGYYSKTNNVNVGYKTGYYTKGSNNVNVGYQAGSNLYVTGNGNVCIGADAGFDNSGASAGNDKTISNSIVIGKEAKATATNQIVIGKNATYSVILAGRKIKFNNDGTVTWEAV